RHEPDRHPRTGQAVSDPYRGAADQRHRAAPRDPRRRGRSRLTSCEGSPTMARRALMLREGIAPVWDRLLTMVFIVGLLHGLLIVGLTFNAAARDRASAPGLEVLLVSDELPE